MPPVLIGGEGERFLLRTVAELGDYWLPMSRNLDVLKKKFAVLQQHCQDVGRDFASIRTALTVPAYLAATRSEAEEWAGGSLQSANSPFAGTPAELCDYLQRYVDLGVTMFHMVFPGFPEIRDMQLFAEEVLPAFRG
jgi:alkanesulfonate monooxygenase SsuD/methylene tetrahydromethanopterin reductase-like flavin-dependent oxidoreductase (luciferase family)